MDTSKVRVLLEVCSLVAKMPSGGGWTKASEMILWSSVAHATTYRYLPKLTNLGYLEVSRRGYRNGFINHYKITDLGERYLSLFNKITW